MNESRPNATNNRRVSIPRLVWDIVILGWVAFALLVVLFAVHEVSVFGKDLYLFRAELIRLEERQRANKETVESLQRQFLSLQRGIPRSRRVLEGDKGDKGSRE